MEKERLEKTVKNSKMPLANAVETTGSVSL